MDTLPCGCTITVDSEGFSNLNCCPRHKALQIHTRKAIKAKKELVLACGCRIQKQMFSDIYRTSLCDEHMRYYDSVNEIYHKNNKVSGLESG